MNTSGDAAEQIVRMSLETGEAALKISGAGAQQLAVLLYAVLKEQKKTRGRARMETMVRSGKPLTVFSVKKGDLKEFVKEAKRYGILYCAIQSPKGKSDGLVDIMVKEEDAPRINRIVERFRLASVKVEPEFQRGRQETGKEVGSQQQQGYQQDSPEQYRSPGDRLAGELSGKQETEKEKRGKEERSRNPFLAETGKTRLSEPIFGRQSGTGAGTSKAGRPVISEKPSVKESLKRMRAAGKKEPDAGKREAAPGLSQVQESRKEKGSSGRARER